MRHRILTDTYLSLFCMETRMLLRAGVTAEEGVLLMLEDETEEDGKEVLRSLLKVLERGEPLSEALRRAEVFPPYMANMAEAGEKTGRLPETLESLAEYYDGRERQAAAIRDAVFHPAILFVMMTAAALILIIGVLPVFNGVFARMGARMTPLAASLMRFGEWLGGLSAVFAALAAAVFAAALTLWLSPGLRGRVMKILMDRLGDRGVFGLVASARFTSAAAMSIASGLEAEEAVRIASSVSGGSAAFDKKAAECLDLTLSGATLPEAMRGAGIISAGDGRLLELGLRGGMTDSALAEIARRKERDARDTIDRITGRIEPALVITASVLIGVILFSVMLPLMGLMVSME